MRSACWRTATRRNRLVLSGAWVGGPGQVPVQSEEQGLTNGSMDGWSMGMHSGGGMFGLVTIVVVIVAAVLLARRK